MYCDEKQIELRKRISMFLLINMTNFDFGVSKYLSSFRVVIGV